MICSLLAKRCVVLKMSWTSAPPWGGAPSMLTRQGSAVFLPLLCSESPGTSALYPSLLIPCYGADSVGCNRPVSIFHSTCKPHLLQLSDHLSFIFILQALGHSLASWCLKKMIGGYEKLYFQTYLLNVFITICSSSPSRLREDAFYSL